MMFMSNKRKLAVVITFSILICVVYVVVWKTHGQLIVDVSDYTKHLDYAAAFVQRNVNSVIKVPKPNVIFILSDDLGWNDVGYHNPDINSPTIDRLAKQGVRLENYYVQSKCSPSRASFLTGLYQSRNGVDRALLTSEAACLPNNLLLLPQVLKQYGYRTHLVGKWHLGWSRKECLPNQRGFDTFLGFHLGAEDHYRHRHGFNKSPTLPDVKFYGFDFWENGNEADNYTGQYSTHVYIKRAEKIVAEHARNGDPMFLFLSLSAVHTPLQVPEEYIKQYEGNITDENRKIYVGMVSCMDEGIRNLTDTLQRYDMWKNTVLIFSSDNGGNNKAGASNYPLKGTKSEFFEGGIRVPGFVYGPFLSTKVRGTEYRGLMGMADWFPTIVEGIAQGTNQPTIDGMNMWDSLRYGLGSLRREYVHAVGGNCDWKYEVNGTDALMYGTLRVNKWKLRLGEQGQKSYYTLEEKERVLSEENHALHDIHNDPYEENNLFRTKLVLRNKMIERLKYHCRRHVPYLQLVERTEASPKYRNGSFSPWLEDGNNLEWKPTTEDLNKFSSVFFAI